MTTYKLEHPDGTHADPPTIRTAVPTWNAGDTIPLGRDRTLRVIDTRLDEGTDGDPISVLVVEAALLQTPRAHRVPHRGCALSNRTMTEPPWHETSGGNGGRREENTDGHPGLVGGLFNGADEALSVPVYSVSSSSFTHKARPSYSKLSWTS